MEPQGKAGAESVTALALAQAILVASLCTSLEALVVSLLNWIVMHVGLQVLLILLGLLLLHLRLVLHAFSKVFHELLTSRTSAAG